MNTTSFISIKDDFLLDSAITYLNHGSFGATPRPVFEAYQTWQRRLEYQPTEFLNRRAPGLLAEARAPLGKYLNTAPDNLVFVTNATVGLNVVAHSLPLGAGDEVLSTDHEYGALDHTWQFLARQRGFKYIRQPISTPMISADDFITQLWRGVTEHTRVIFLSHITSPTALIFPVEAVCRRARAEGILTVIDGAHVPGQLPLDLDTLGADFYSGNLHKWLCAPKGAAFLYASPARQSLIQPLIVSWGWLPDATSPQPLTDYLEWTGTRDLSAFLSVPDAIRYHQEHDWATVQAECHQLASLALQRVGQITGLPALSPDSPEWFGQMVSIPLPQTIQPEAFHQALYDRFRIEAPLITWNGRYFVRVSFQVYNCAAEIDQLEAAVRSLLAA